jgi:dsDNA-specific endonuclease/ATPase MutS2
MADNQDNRIEIELLKKDVNIITNLCEKFDTTIDKMQEIASNLSRMVSLQEQRIETQEKVTKEVQNVLEMRRQEHIEDIKDLHSRITTVNRELSSKIEQSENKILAELHCLKTELIKEKKTFGQRLSEIEAWKYTMVGALMVVTWILAKIDFNTLIKILFTR